MDSGQEEAPQIDFSHAARFAAALARQLAADPLPRYGADGNLGGETIDAFERFMRDHAAEAPPTADTIDDAEIELLRRVAAAAPTSPIPVNRAPA